MSAEEQKKAEDPGSESTEGGSALSDLGLNQKPSNNQAAHPKDQQRSPLKNFKNFMRSYRVREFTKDPKTWFEIAALIVVICYTRYAGQQAKTMSDTLVEIRLQTNSAGEAANAAKKAATATKDSVDLARKNAHFDQRAWLGISYGTYKYTVNETFGATYDVIDTGKTPARNVSGTAVTHFMRVRNAPKFTYEHGTSADLGTMLPNVHQGAISWLIPQNIRKEIAVQPMKISDEIFRALHDGSGYMMIYGNINYDSVFGAHHWIKFCATSGPTPYTQAKECIQYNDVDNNEEP